MPRGLGHIRAADAREALQHQETFLPSRPWNDGVTNGLGVRWPAAVFAQTQGLMALPKPPSTCVAYAVFQLDRDDPPAPNRAYPARMGPMPGKNGQRKRCPPFLMGTRPLSPGRPLSEPVGTPNFCMVLLLRTCDVGSLFRRDFTGIHFRPTMFHPSAAVWVFLLWCLKVPI